MPVTTAEILGALDPEQLEAVTSEAALTKVVAGAGTGKTRTLTYTVAYWVLERGLDPRNVVAITFTNDAANEVRERLSGLLGEDVQTQVFTFHSYCVRILRRHAEMAGFRDSRFMIADEEMSKELLVEAVDQSGVFPPFNEPLREDYDSDKAHDEAVKSVRSEYQKYRKEFIKNASHKIGRWKDNGLTLAMVTDPNRPRRSTFDEDVAQVYVAYEEALAKRNMTDFGGLILRVVELFRAHPDIARVEAERVQYLLVDEFQDTNPTQMLLVLHLIAVNDRLMVVGDTDQSLYAFRDAVAELMMELSHPNMKEVVLFRNRRCTDQILRPANRIVDENPRAEPKVLESGRDGDEVEFLSYDSDYAEAFGIARHVQRLINDGVEPKQIGILYRLSYPMTTLEQALIKCRIPYVLAGGFKFTDREQVKDVLAYLRLAVDPFNDLSFRRIYSRPTRGLGAAALDAINRTARTHGVGFADACEILANDPAKSTRSRPGLSKEGREEALKLSEGLRHLHEAYREGVETTLLVRYILNNLGYANWAVDVKDDDDRRKIEDTLRRIEDMADQEPDALEFVNSVCLMGEKEEDDALDNAVRVMTIHASKGKEFDYVFGPAFEDGIIPSQRALEEEPGDRFDPWVGCSPGGIEEERRLAHVLITRSRHGVYLSMARRRATRSSSARPQPSRFLEPLIEDNLITLKTISKDGVPAAKRRDKGRSASVLPYQKSGFARSFGARR